MVTKKRTSEVSISKVFHLCAVLFPSAEVNIHSPVHWIVRLNTYLYTYSPFMF